MTIRMLDDLDTALHAFGLDYDEVPATAWDPTHATSWRTRSRPPSTGNFDPIGVLCHHTADPGATVANNLAVILKGNSEAPGPIAQLYISREPRVYIVAAGRANHGGKGTINGNTCDDMNARLIGIEVSNSGLGEYWPDAQIDLYANVVAALRTWYRWGRDFVWLHHVTGPACRNYKIDPAGPSKLDPTLPGGAAGSWSLDTWRAFVESKMHVAPPQPVPLPPYPTPQPGAEDMIRHPFIRKAGKFATWHSNGVVRSWVQTPLNLRQQLFEAGLIDDAGYQQLSDEQLRSAPYVTDVGDLGGYGAVVGPDPGDV